MPGIGARHYLSNDLSIVCFVDEHASMVVVGAAFIFLYIAGIPLLMFLLLWRNRSALWDEKHPRHEEMLFELGSLYTSCELFRSLHDFILKLSVQICKYTHMRYFYYTITDEQQFWWFEIFVSDLPCAVLPRFDLFSLFFSISWMPGNTVHISHPYPY